MYQLVVTLLPEILTYSTSILLAPTPNGNILYLSPTNPNKEMPGIAINQGAEIRSQQPKLGFGGKFGFASDRLFSNQGTTLGKVARYTADLVSSSDYYPFGMQMPGRKVDSGKYRYGFNGKEKDQEGMGGGGSTYDYGFRIYNAQVAKFLSVDPLSASYPWYTPYQFAGNKPIIAIDLDGLEEYIRVNIYSKTKTEQFLLGVPLFLRSEVKKLDKVGVLGYGTLTLYMYEDGTAFSNPRFLRNAFDIIKNIYEGITVPNIDKAMLVLRRIFEINSGILVYGESGAGSSNSPGTKTKSFFASFDFAAFNEMMDVVLQGMASKGENDISEPEILEIAKEADAQVKEFKNKRLLKAVEEAKKKKEQTKKETTSTKNAKDPNEIVRIDIKSNTGGYTTRPVFRKDSLKTVEEINKSGTHKVVDIVQKKEQK